MKTEKELEHFTNFLSAMREKFCTENDSDLEIMTGFFDAVEREGTDDIVLKNKSCREVLEGVLVKLNKELERRTQLN